MCATKAPVVSTQIQNTKGSFFMTYERAFVPCNLLLQLMSNPDTFVEPRKRYTSEGRMFSIHFVADDNNRVYSCVTDKEYSSRIAFAMLEEMQTKFLTKVRLSYCLSC